MERSTKKWIKGKAFDWWIAPNVPKTPGSVRQMSSDIKDTYDSGKQIQRDADPRVAAHRATEEGEEANRKLNGTRYAIRVARFLWG